MTSRTRPNRQLKTPLLIGLVASLCLTGCASDVPVIKPVAMSQPGDLELGCAELAAQMEVNQARAADFLKVHQSTESGNQAKGVAFVALAPVMLVAALLTSSSIDISRADETQARALVDRNERLAYLAKKKGCPTP